ncbi:hypothetical protein [Arthrobacter sp. HLT1-20]
MAATHHSSRGWPVLAGALIVIGALLAPVAVVASWAGAQLTTTDAFVAMFGPLAKDAGVQALVAEQTSTVITANVDIASLTSDAVDGIIGLGTGPAATRALESLKGPAAQGIKSLLRSSVDTFVESDSFAQLWRQSLRLSHSQLVATLRNDPQAVVSAGSDGAIGIALGPIIEGAKAALAGQGWGFAAQIPAVDHTLVLARNDSVPTLQLIYGIAVAAGVWLPWVALVFLAAGVLLARRAALALIWAAAALALGMVVLMAAIALGRRLAIESLAPAHPLADVTLTVFDAATQGMKSTAVTVLVLALVMAVAGWLAGPALSRRRRPHW